MSRVRIIGITQPRIEGCATAEEFIAYCARVSNPANQQNYDTAGKLLKYCIDNKHWSIFEQVHIVVSIETTRDIGRQILRHRSFSFQEFSQRYADPTLLEYEIRETRLQDTKNRQNSVEANDEELDKLWRAKQTQLLHESRMAYKWALDNGIAKEQARVVLPEGNTMSRMYMSGSLRSWIHYCLLRMSNGTQKEHREIAAECWHLLKRDFKFLETL